MKKLVTLTIACIMGLTVLSPILNAVNAGEGEEKGKKENKPYAFGKVEVVRDGDKVTEIYVTYKDQKVPIVVDDIGLQLVQYEGKIVKVTGVRMEDGSIAVKNFKEKQNAPRGKNAKKAEEEVENAETKECKEGKKAKKAKEYQKENRECEGKKSEE